MAITEEQVLKVKIGIEPHFVPMITWVLSVFCEYSGCSFEHVSDGSDVYLSYDTGSTVYLSEVFWSSVVDKSYEDIVLGGESGLEICENGSTDFLATAFYFLNCLWEYSTNSDKDNWGRSEFGSSIWKKKGFDRPFCHVNSIFDLLASHLGVIVRRRPSRVFLSHDIDAVYSGWKEDGLTAFRKGRIFSFVSIMTRKFFGKTDWFNFSDIALLEKKHGMRSTFFWIPVTGKVEGVGKNADYDICSEAFRKPLHDLSQMGFEHGLHKSLLPYSIQQEMKMLPFSVATNRYHYLKFKFTDLISQMSDSELSIDCSLGYAQTYGYRNGYSLPYRPFCIEKNEEADFIEVPLTIMDATFSRYLRKTPIEATEEIIDFLKMHSENSVISILWHNTHFTNFKYEGYRRVYISVLEWLREHKIKGIGPTEFLEHGW